MKLEDVLLNYITPIRKFEELGPNFTGNDLYNYFRKQTEFKDIEAFTRPRFERKTVLYLDSQEQYDFLTDKSKDITALSQKLFEKRFPKYYEEDPAAKFRKSFENN